MGMKLVYYLAIITIIVLIILFAISNKKPPAITTGYLLPQAKPMLGKLNFINDNKQLSDLKQIAKNKWALLYFGYTTCPSICPVEMALLNKVVKKMQNAKQLQVVFVSIDPKRDIGKLDNYAQQFNKTFIGLSAKEDDLVNITKELGVYYQYIAIKKRTTQDHSKHKYHNMQQEIDHTSSFILLDKNMNYVVVFTTPHNVNKLAQSLDAIIDN